MRNGDRKGFFGSGYSAVALLVLVCTSMSAMAAIDVVSTKVSYDTGATDPDNTISSFTVAAGSNRKLVVCASWESGDTPVSATWKGSETFTVAVNTEGGRNAAILYLDNPATGTGDIVVTFGGNTISRVGAISLTGAAAGVAQTARVRNAMSLDLATAQADTLVVGAYTSNNNYPASGVVSPFSSSLYTGDSGSSHGDAGYQTEAAAGANTYTWTDSAANDPNIALAAFTPYAAANVVPNAVTTGADPADSATNVAWGLSALSWTAPAADGTHDPAQGYEVYFGTNGVVTANTSYATSLNALDLSSLPPLEADTTYHWRVDATNAAGSTTGAAWRFTTSDGRPTVDNASGPTSVGWTTARLWGQVTATNGAAPSVVRIYFGDNNGGTTPSSWDTSFAVSSWDEGVAFSQDVSNLPYGKPYYYSVYASSSYGDVWSTVTNFATASSAAGSASGGDVVYTTNDINGVTWKVHIFTNVGANTLTFSNAGEVEYLIVGGGAGGGLSSGTPGKYGAGGGGAGGLLTNVEGALLTVTAGSHTVTVGAGGAVQTTAGYRGYRGGDSSFFGVTASGGGSGAGGAQGALSGGSGGGGANSGGGAAGTAGQGYKGGNGGTNRGGGGGGAGRAGYDSVRSSTGAGGNGLQNAITGASVWYAGGGAGDYGPDSLGGGGASGLAGTDGLGGGGGARGAKGGSGIVIVRYIPPAAGTVMFVR